MKKMILLMIALAMMIVIVGCAAEPTTVVNEDGEISSVTVSTVSVSGSGEITVEPDMATVQFGVEINGENAQETMSEASNCINNIIASVMANGVKEEDITTSNLSLYQSYVYDDNGNREKLIYTAYHNVEVKIYDIDSAGKVIDGAVEAGANTTYGIRFELSDASAYEAELLKLAVDNAKMRAQAIAAASGMRLGDPITITDGTMSEPEIIYNDIPHAEEAEDSDISTSISPGRMYLTANVTVRYALD